MVVSESDLLVFMRLVWTIIFSFEIKDRMIYYYFCGTWNVIISLLI